MKAMILKNQSKSKDKGAQPNLLANLFYKSKASNEEAKTNEDDAAHQISNKPVIKLKLKSKQIKLAKRGQSAKPAPSESKLQKTGDTTAKISANMINEEIGKQLGGEVKKKIKIKLRGASTAPEQK